MRIGSWQIVGGVSTRGVARQPTGISRSLILTRPGRRRGVATTARRKRRGLSAGTTTLSLTSPVVAVNPECHFDECGEILRMTYERHCILDAVGKASVELVAESLFIVSN